MKYKVIFLDWNKTLNHDRFFGHWQIENPSFYNAIQERLFTPQSARIHRWMRGQHRSEEILEFVSEFIHLPKHVLLAELRKSCEAMTLVDPRILHYTEKARSVGTRIVIATDNMDTFTRWTVPALKLYNYFDDVLNSYDLGVLKKDLTEKGELAFFESYLKKHQLKPNECVMVDDGAKLGLILQSAGMDFRLVDAEHSAFHHLQSLVTE